MEDMRRSNYGGRSMEQGDERRDRRYGSNFGEGARPYGEDYGEDRGYEQNSQSRYSLENRMRSGNRAGFRPEGVNEPSDWWMEDQGFDYGMSRTGSHSQVGGFHFDEDAYDDRRGRRYGGPDMERRGYMSEDDYDRGSPYHRQNRGYGDRRGYSPEDYGYYRERYRRSEYPETYRSARGGYMSEHVGSDSGRRDYNTHPGRGNLYGSQYEPSEGMHRGKGPKDYRRSDERILEEINDHLTDDPFVDASDVEVSVENGEVILTGSAVDKTQKRRIEDIVGAVSGVTQVENRLRRPLMSTPF